MLRKSTNDLSIKPKMSKSVQMALIVGGLFALIVSWYFVHRSGVQSGHKKYADDQIMIGQLNDTIGSLREGLSKAEENFVFAQRQQQIQEEAYKQISKAYANSEQKNRVLGSRLDFYRSIISPEDGQSGPAIQSLAYEYADGLVSFDVTLVQAIKHKHQVRGSLKLTLYNGDVALGQWPASSPRSVSYQYFEQISGSIEAAELSDSAKMKVELSMQGGKKLQRWFEVVKNDTATNG